METESKIIEFQLTSEQQRYLQSVLPKGYSIQFSNKPSRRDSFTKSNKSSNFENISKLKKVKTNGFEEEYPGKRTLREKRTKMPYEARFQDLEASNKYKGTSEIYRKASRILQTLKRHACVPPFLHPVDPIALQIPDYYDIVKDPMDLATVEKNVKANHYTTFSDLVADIRKIWTNSFNYNAPETQIHQMTVEISTFFEKLLQEIEANPSQSGVEINELQKKVDRLTREIKDLHKNDTKPTKSKKNTTSNLEKPMSIQEKRALGQNIHSLPPESLRGVWEIVSKALPDSKKHNEELEFDLNDLPTRVLRELEKYVKAKLDAQNTGSRREQSPVNIQPMPTTVLSSFTQAEENVSGLEDFTGGSGHKEPEIPKALNESISSESSFITESDDSMSIKEGK